MHSFKDASGHTWDLNLNLAAAERIDKCDFSLLTDEKFSILAPTEKAFELFTSDTAVIFACIWCIIHPQATELGIDQDQFKERINGDTIYPAKKAFWGALQDFFPEQRTVLSKMVEMFDLTLKKKSEGLKKLLPEVEKAVERDIDKMIEKTKEELSKT